MPKILAIDDKQDNLLVIKALLKNLMPECTVLTALSGHEGIEKCAEEQPDTIILDVKMPGMDGYEVCRLLKSSEKTSHIPIVMLTAVDTRSTSKAEGLGAGADAFLTKPIDEIELVAQIHVMLRIKRSEDLLRREKELLEIQVQERTKELRCLYDISTLTRSTTNTFDEVIQHIVAVIPPSWHYPANTCARIVLENKAYITDEFEETRWKQSCDIILGEKKIGTVEVFYKEKKPNADEGPFFFKERRLIKQIAEQLSKIVDRKIAAEEKITLQKQLLQAQKLEAVGTLAGGIAHDFNNILSAIIGFSELIKEELPANSIIMKDIDMVLASGHRAAELVKQILTFSRKSDIEKQPIQPHLIVNEALKMLRATVPATVTIRADINQKCGFIMADPTTIHQVTLNLCTNALHAMAEQKGTLGISMDRRELSDLEIKGKLALDPGSYVVLDVSDTGCGMGQGTIDRIFDPYFTTKKQGRGTGLGLAVTHGIVKDAKGFIRVESRPGEGSTFTVYLPTFSDILPNDEPVEQPVQEPNHNEHILVVDDEAFLLHVTQRKLEQSGYKVTTTTNSKAALDKINANPRLFDLLITDMTMPGLTGMELASAVFKLRPDFPIILCSGHSDLVSRQTALESGIRRYLSKPVKGDELLDAIRSVLD